MRKFESVGIAVPDVLLPANADAAERWAVVACDQYTSQPEYWEQVKKTVGNAPSTLNIIYPEVFLNEPEATRKTASGRSTDRCANTWTVVCLNRARD